MMQPVNDPMLRPLVQTHKTYGLITGLVIIVLSAVVYVTNLSEESWIKYLLYAVFLGGLILNAMAFSKANEGAVTFGQVFSSGFKATAIVTILAVAWVILSINIFPEMKDKALEIARMQMEKDGTMDPDMMEKALTMTRNNFTTFLVMGAVFGYLIMGLIFSLLAAAVAPKNKRPLTPVV
ncbi:MAG: DUF4199 domain-containing protein [Sphingobacteriales bacterium]|nr:MAG: DUF4199 domain-containing protein [Sphingobacteriales bacterium]